MKPKKLYTSSAFTTHTSVPAGNDRFPQEMMERYLKGYVEHSLKISFEEFMKLGRVYPEDKSEWFCMTVLALKLSHFNNGVSKLHGRVSRDMWKDIWTGVPVAEVPIGYITNGIHMNSWISKECLTFSSVTLARWVDAPTNTKHGKRMKFLIRNCGARTSAEKKGLWNLSAENLVPVKARGSQKKK